MSTQAEHSESAIPVWPGWQSLLFMPASSPRFADKVGALPVDAVIIDLEESVAQGDKSQARSNVPDMLAKLGTEGVDALVRVDPSRLMELLRDIEACVHADVRAVVVPKAEGTERVRLVDELLAELEADAGLPVGGIKLIPMVESAAGLLQAPALAKACDRVLALAVGPEDLAFDLGGEPGAALLTEPCRRVAWAAKAAGREAIGFPGAIANYSDMPRLERDLRSARSLGFRAGLCIHPKQLQACRAAFAVTGGEADWARRVDTAFAEVEKAGGCLCSVDGQMIDRPVALRARALLAQWRQQQGQRQHEHQGGRVGGRKVTGDIE